MASFRHAKLFLNCQSLAKKPYVTLFNSFIQFKYLILWFLGIVTRQMSGGHAETMKIRPSRWSWNRFKDMLHFYFLLGIIPLTVFTTCVNIFVGPARLVDIPEGYVPEEHEYYQVAPRWESWSWFWSNVDLPVQHPVTRWISRNIVRSYQMEYEMYCQHVFEEEYKKNLRSLKF